MEIPRTQPNGIPQPEYPGSPPRSRNPLDSIGRPSSQTFAAREAFLSSEYGRPKVQQSPSFFTAAAAEGFGRSASSSSMPRIGSRTSSPVRGGVPPSTSGGASLLIVNVDTALDLTPADVYGPHYYRATAHYVGEPEDEVLARQTPTIKANRSKTDDKKENCVLHKRIQVPYNSRQQFLMVDILDATDGMGLDTFIGQATIPLADPRLSSTTPWPLIREGEQTGVVTLNIQIPSDAHSGHARPRSPSPSPSGSFNMTMQRDPSWSPSSPSKDPLAMQAAYRESFGHSYRTPYGPPPATSSFGAASIGNPTDTLPWSGPAGRPPSPARVNGLSPTDTVPWGPPPPRSARVNGLGPTDTTPWTGPAVSNGGSFSIARGPTDTMPWTGPAMSSSASFLAVGNLQPSVSFPVASAMTGMSFPKIDASTPPVPPIPTGEFPKADFMAEIPTTFSSGLAPDIFAGLQLPDSTPGSYLAPPLFSNTSSLPFTNPGGSGSSYIPPAFSSVPGATKNSSFSPPMPSLFTGSSSSSSYATPPALPSLVGRGSANSGSYITPPPLPPAGGGGFGSGGSYMIPPPLPSLYSGGGSATPTAPAWQPSNSASTAWGGLGGSSSTSAFSTPSLGLGNSASIAWGGLGGSSSTSAFSTPSLGLG
eukprot:CAMPEP_0169321834 /NCGR_PEP_ID=MMETSP1017-20121227/9103_1 /TAXON_ID=342587 /ORGANISM="Karlodinium micrum, Strain CCMP2283" /LENGTH=647 /DNA_ID=CAMNT_0009416347 /DNA_START=100 /DNA_END=2039 /DNA_ORIENTATION=-